MNINQDNSHIKFTPRKDDTSSSGSSGADLGTRPAIDPKSTKSFKKILDKGDGDKGKSRDIKAQNVSEEEEEISLLNEEEETTQKNAPLSLFDLSSSSRALAAKPTGQENVTLPSRFQKSDAEDSSKIDPKDLEAQGESEMIGSDKLANPKKPESPSNVFGKMTTKGTKYPSAAVAASHAAKVENKKENFTSRFATEQSDLSYVNPMALTTQAMQEIDMKTEKATLPVSNIQDIINQLVDKVAEMKDQGRTDTVVTLKQPPTLAGANLVVTAFDSAKGEFNISFENLTQAAKNLLDQRANQQSLKLALEEKGYAVHIITTTTLVENRPIETSSMQQDRENSREGRREGRQREGKENET